jgi:hypothetical protein
VLAWISGLLAFLPRHVAAWPVAGFALLASPVWPGLEAGPGDPSGASIVWLGLFTGCAVALRTRCDDRRFIARLPAVGALLLAGDALDRGVRAVFGVARQRLPTDWTVDALGVAVLAALCAAIAWTIASGSRSDARGAGKAPPRAAAWRLALPLPLERWTQNRFVNRVLQKALFAGAASLSFVYVMFATR